MFSITNLQKNSHKTLVKRYIILFIINKWSKSHRHIVRIECLFNLCFLCMYDVQNALYIKYIWYYSELKLCLLSLPKSIAYIGKRCRLC